MGRGHAALLICLACGDSAPAPGAAPGTIAFGIVGDAPYSTFDGPKYATVLGELDTDSLAFVLHVGDLLSGRCDDAVLEARLTELQRLRPPVIYTPGDNEWTDCHRPRSGRYRPLERLATVRRLFFSEPGRTLGARPMVVESQSADTTWADTPENVRWRMGRVVFATLHLVGSGHASRPFAGRSSADDSVAARQMAAALSWMDSTFARAQRDSARAVVLTFHANVGFGSRSGIRDGYEAFVPRLRTHAAAFPGTTVLIHGDTHDFTFDQALRDSSGATIARAWRIETTGSPAVGWTRVVMDTTTGILLGVRSQLAPVWRVF